MTALRMPKRARRKYMKRDMVRIVAGMGNCAKVRGVKARFRLFKG
jgi:hypothetical protein